MENKTRAFSTLEDGLAYIERYYRIDVEAITQLINNMISTLPEEPSEYWMFTNVFIAEGLRKHGGWLLESLQNLFDSFDIATDTPEYEDALEKLSQISRAALDETKYLQLCKAVSQWQQREKEQDNPTIIKDGEWV